MMTCQKVSTDKFNYSRAIAHHILLQGPLETTASTDHHMNSIVSPKLNHGNLDTHVPGPFRPNYWSLDRSFVALPMRKKGIYVVFVASSWHRASKHFGFIE